MTESQCGYVRSTLQQFDARRRGKKGLQFSRLKEGTHGSGESLPSDPGSELRVGREEEKEKVRQIIINEHKKQKNKTAVRECEYKQASTSRFDNNAL